MDEIDLPVHYGDWIKRRRKTLDLTQEDLAERASCSVSALRKIEAGHRRPSKLLADLLAKALEIPEDTRDEFVRVLRGAQSLQRLPLPLKPPPTQLTPVPDHTALQPDLPFLPTPFLGREGEIKSITRLLQDRQCRLLTLVGPGGIGKTRLAIEAAFQVRDFFRNEIYFVSLDPLNSPEFVPSVIAETLGFAFQGQASPRSELLNYLRNRNALLILDSVEHLLEGVDLFVEILQFSPGMKLLVTSRERLNLHGEWLFDVQGLPVPFIGDHQALEEHSSIALFLQTARRSRAGFELRTDCLEEIVTICQLLEGMPLAIELAAGWVNLLTCKEIRQEIEQNLSFLSTRFRDVPERHRSLTAVFDHSWNLLTPAERMSLSKLSVFRGGFRREAALKVANASINMLSVLLNKSLVRPKEGERYDLHEAIRQYANARLSADPKEEEQAHQIHSSYFLELITKSKARMMSNDQIVTLSALNLEVDNLRMAWDWAVERKRLSDIQESFDAVWRFYAYQSLFQEGIQVFEKVIHAFSDSVGGVGGIAKDCANVLGQALAKVGWFNFRLGKLDLSIRMLRQSLDLVKETDDPAAKAFSLTSLGGILAISNGDPQGEAMLKESMGITRAIHDPWVTSISLANLAIATLTWKGYEPATELFREAVAEARIAGDPSIIAFCLTYSGLAAFAGGNLNDAYILISESLALSRACDNRWDIATALRHLGRIACAQGRPAEALERFRESIEIFSEQGECLGQARTLNQYGEAALVLKNYAEARRSFQASLQIAVQNQAIPIALMALCGMAGLLAEEGDIQTSAELLTVVQHHPASEQETKEHCAQLLKKLMPQPPVEIEVSALLEKKPYETWVDSILAV